MVREKTKIKFGMGNEAITEGAIAAGANFYAGYPITPSSEIAELSSVRLPEIGGVFIQMEDEIGSMAAIIGASSSGAKSFTATSGPGISLIQENIGVAIMSEVPCVVINVQRSGPSTGLATKPSQGDLMQARWGTHGDHSIIAISPSTVQECYNLTIKAFNLAEKYRTPVYILADEIIGHMYEQYELRENMEIVKRKHPDNSVTGGDFKLFDFTSYSDHIAPMPPYGSKYIIRMNGSTHDEYGYGCSDPANADRFIRHYTDKIEKNKDDIVMTERIHMDDAEYAIITYGCSVRSALSAMTMAREKGIKVGVLKLLTIWPFADKQVKQVLSCVKGVIVPELNLGQIKSEIERFNNKKIPVIGINKIDSTMISPYEILEVLRGAEK